MHIHAFHCDGAVALIFKYERADVETLKECFWEVAKQSGIHKDEVGNFDHEHKYWWVADRHYGTLCGELLQRGVGIVDMGAHNG